MLVAVYWNPRAATLEQAAVLLLAACQALADAGYAALRRKALSRRAAQAAVFQPTMDEALQLLAGGINRRDIDQTPMPELGFRFGLWSGPSDDAAYDFTGQIGNTTDIGSNCLLLRLPAAGPLSYDGNAGRVHLLFKAWVALARADQGVICAPQAIAWEGRRLSPAMPCLARHDTVDPLPAENRATHAGRNGIFSSLRRVLANIRDGRDPAAARPDPDDPPSQAYRDRMAAVEQTEHFVATLADRVPPPLLAALQQTITHLQQPLLDLPALAAHVAAQHQASRFAVNRGGLVVTPDQQQQLAQLADLEHLLARLAQGQRPAP